MPTTTRKHQKAFDAFPAAWRSLIIQLETSQAKLKESRALGLDWSDSDFVKGSAMPSSTWNMLKSGKHPLSTTPKGIQTVTDKLTALQASAAEVQLKIRDAALRSTQQEPQLLTGFVEDVNSQAVLAALGKCQRLAEESSEERLIVIRAATGEGKTWLRRWLVTKGHVHYVVSARPSWRRNYTAFLRSVAGVLNLDVAAIRAAAELEAEIITKASTIAGVVWLEEVQSLSAMAQEFIKLLLNETHLTAIIVLTPEAYTAMKHAASGDTLQLFRRAACNMELAHADEAFLRATAPDLWCKTHEKGCMQRILAEAERFGGRALIKDVTARLRTATAKVAFITLNDVEDALSCYRANVPDLATARRAFGQARPKAA
ncbi:MAG: AAA family ATPase [Verrucomicrobiota bacterium]